MPEEKSHPLGDTRAYKRVKINIKLCFEIDESMKKCVRFSKDIIETTTSDISAGGIAVPCGYFIPKGTLLNISLAREPFYPASKQGEFIKILGKVASCAMESRNTYRLGIQFTQIDVKDKEAIEQFVTSHEKNT